MKKIMLSINLILILFLTSCFNLSEYKSKTLFLFDTTINMTFYNLNDADTHCTNIQKMLKEISKVASNYESYSDKSVYDLNEKRSINKNEYLTEMINFAIEAKKLTNGYFEPLIGNLSMIWKDAIENQVLPTDDVIAIELDIIKESSIKITDDKIELVGDASLDLGGFIKGYACYKVDNYLKENNIKYYIVNMGESNILLGSKIGHDFTFAFKDPLKEAYYAEGKIQNMCISTSSIEYQRVKINDKYYHHIISPFTGYPVNYYTSVNVITNNILYSDAFSTAIFLMDKDMASKYAKDNNFGIVLFNDSIIYKSDGYDYVKAL